MLLQALLQQFEALARVQPVLMIFEDAHWIDPTSRELLDLTLARLARLPVLLVITFRPEFQHSWAGQPNITLLVLNRLGERDVAALVRGLAGNTALASDIIEEIAERTDGVPLFVEELTKAVLERGAAATLSASPLSSLSVPATLHASLIARLDRLGFAANEIAQIGSVIGREFSYEIVEAVAQRTEAELRSALDRLSAAGLLFCRGTPPYSSYLFKHALIQDAAYGTLLRGRRQALHARTATVLEGRFGELVERQPELLAHHLTGAGDPERAVGQWLKAGLHAAGRSAHREAIAHLERGISLLPGVPDTPDRDSVEIDLQLALGMSSIRAKGMISPSVREAYGRAGELAEKHHDQVRLFQAVYGVWQHNVASGRIVNARPLSERLLTVTSHVDADPGLRLQAHHAVWTTYMIAGEETACVEHCEIGLQRYDPERYGSHRDLYGGHDAGVCAWSLGAQAKWLLGYPDAALSGQAEGLALANRISHAPTLIFALSYAALLHVHRREPEMILSRLVAAEAVAAEQRLSVFLNPQVLRGVVLFMRGEAPDAIRYLREGLPPGRSGGVRLLGFCLLGEALARQGASEEALSMIDGALKAAEATGEGWFSHELHRSRGIVLLRQNRIQEGEAALCQAMQVARDQRAKSRELRVATSLARLWGEQGRRREAHELLAPVYDWFTEGFDTADLREAKALLGDLA
jgi:predicted ATPase